MEFSKVDSKKKMIEKEPNNKRKKPKINTCYIHEKKNNFSLFNVDVNVNTFEVDEYAIILPNEPISPYKMNKNNDLH